MGLVGREIELAACQQALSAGDTGAGAVITGPPGFGKTSIWRAAAEAQPPAVAVLKTTGVESWQAAFANLADLLEPIADVALPRLPETQAHALEVVLGLAPSRTAVSETLLERAVVGSLRHVARSGLLIAVDDEQWIDGDTRRVLEVAAVRLTDAPVRWLVSARTGHADRGLAGVLHHELAERATRVELTGLGDAPLTELILGRFPGRWSPAVLRQVVALAAGSPYAALELARETMARGGHDAGLVHLPPTLEKSLRDRLERLGPETLDVLQAAALAGAPSRKLLSAVLDRPVDARVDDALEAGVLEAAPPDPVLRFSHPLLREAAEGLLTGPGHRRLHRLIGAAHSDPDEAAWHLARGADEPDEELAAKAEEATRHAIARGALARAVALSQAAAELTPDAQSLTAWQRRVVWLERLLAAGEFDRAHDLGEKWAPHVPSAVRGRITAARAETAPDMESTYALNVEAFADLADRDPRRAALLGIRIFVSAVVIGHLDWARPHVAAAADQARIANEPRALREALAADAMLGAFAGEPGAGAGLQAAVRLPGFADTSELYTSPENGLALWHLWRGEINPARDLLHMLLERAEQLGSQENANGARLHLAEVEWRAGNWDIARAHTEVLARWNRYTRHPQEGTAAYLVALVESGCGELDRARELAANGIAQTEAKQDWTYAAYCRWVAGLTELSVDDPAAALRWLHPVVGMPQSVGIGNPGVYPFTPDMIEAWAATGELDQAADRLAWLKEAALRQDHPWARITAGRAEASLLLAHHDPVAAAVAVRDVIPEARSLGLPFELGRCLLVLGTAERKARQRRQAAATLDEAAATFRDLGASRWRALATAQRTRLAPGTDGSLTAAEQRIADLVAAGHSNPEIAAVMFISVKTVEANLTRIYRKLGMRSRVDLARTKRTD